MGNQGVVRRQAKGLTFLEAQWAPVFANHLKDIEKYAAKMSKFKKVEKVTANLVKNAW